METIRCTEVRVRDRNRRQILRWQRPLFGSLTVQNQGRRVLIKRSSLFGFDTKTYLCSGVETVETKKAWWEILL